MPEVIDCAYESSAVLRPNLIVDVTGEWQEVLAAAGSFASQNRLLPYLEVLDARATARRLTMPPLVRRAEAFHVVDLRFIRTHSASEWAAAQGPSAELEEPGDAARLDVVIRTRNRPQLLREALATVAGQHHPPGRVIVINDGGVSVSDLCAEWRERLGLDLVEFAGSRGRSAAAQLVKAPVGSNGIINKPAV